MSINSLITCMEVPGNNRGDTTDGMETAWLGEMMES